MQRSQLLRLRPDFPDVFPDDIDDLLLALSEASYEWSDSRMAFVNSELQKAIPIAELHRFTARRIREWWGDEDFVTENDKLKSLTKFGCAGIVAVPVALILCFTWDWLFGLLLAVISIAVVMVTNTKKNALLTEREKREGRWVDRSKIEWCKNCIHFRRIRGWEDNLWQLEALPTDGRLPCKIFDQTTEVWQSYASLDPKQRTMYPKQCSYLKMKS
ncbi:MAG: hypothetical protein WD342_05125 [Verrucomicrobiales bacterium]